MIQDPEYVIDRILGEELIEKDDWIRYINKIVYGTFEIPNNLTDILGTEGMYQPILSSQPGLLDVYKELQQNSSDNFKDFTNNNNVKKFTLYEPFNPDKVRNFTYTQKPQEQADDSKVNYFRRTFTSGQNSGPLNEYNEKYSFNL